MKENPVEVFGAFAAHRSCELFAAHRYLQGAATPREMRPRFDDPAAPSRASCRQPVCLAASTLASILATGIEPLRASWAASAATKMSIRVSSSSKRGGVEYAATADGDKVVDREQCTALVDISNAVFEATGHVQSNPDPIGIGAAVLAKATFRFPYAGMTAEAIDHDR